MRSQQGGPALTEGSANSNQQMSGAIVKKEVPSSGSRGSYASVQNLVTATDITWSLETQFSHL